MERYVAYFRVSTEKQGRSGLGLEAQRTSVLSYVKDPALIVAEFCDIESGKKDIRPELLKAVDFAKKHDAKLLIAKLDRLSRNLTFISSLMDSKVKFVCADMPEANEFTIHIFAALAQQERKMISERTKQALDEKRRQQGEWRISGKSFKRGEVLSRAVATNRQKAADNEHNKKASALIKALKKEGKNYVQIAQELNESGYKTAQGKVFRPMQVQRLYLRMQKPTSKA